MTSVDFLPERIKAARARRRRLTRQVYLLCAGAVALAALGLVRHGRIQQARADLVLLDESAANLHQQMSKVQDLEQQLCGLLLIERIEQNLGRRVNTVGLLGELERLMPPSMALTNLLVETKEFSVPVASALGAAASGMVQSADPADESDTVILKRVMLKLTGLAPTDVDVAIFIGQLSACPAFEDVDMGYAKNVTFGNRTARQFEASCYVAR